MECQHLGKIYKVRRRIKVSASGKGRTDLTLERRAADGTWSALEKTDVEEVFGFSLKGLEATMFLRSYGAKGLGDFAAVDAADRKELLFKLRGLQHYKALGERAHGIVSLASDVCDRADGEIQGLETQRIEAESAGGLLDQKRADLRSVTERAGALEAELQTAKAAQAEADQLRVKLEGAQQRETDARTSLTTAEVRRQGLENRMQEIIDLDRRKADIEAAERLASQCRSDWKKANRNVVAIEAGLVGKRSAHEEAIRLHSAAEADLAAGRAAEERTKRRQTAQATKSAAERDLPKARAAANYHAIIGQTQTAIDQARESSQLLKAVPCNGIGTYAGCQFLKNATAAASNVQTLEAELQGAVESLQATGVDGEKAADRVRALESALQSARGVLEGLGDEPSADVAQLEAAERRANTHRLQKKADVDGAEAKLREWKGHRDRALTEGKKAAAVAGQRGALEQSVRRFEELQKEHADALLEEKRCRGRLEELKAAADAIAEQLEQLASEDRAPALARQLRETLEERDALTREIGRLEERAGRLESITADLQERRAQRSRAGRRMASAALLKRFYRDAPTLIVEHDLAAVEAEANDWLGRTSHHRVKIATQTTARTSTRVKETLVIQVQKASGPWTDRDVLSGSEVFRVDLAVALAIGKVLGVGQAWLFLDEGFGTLRGATIDDVVGALEAVLPELGSLWAITHVPQVAAVFPTAMEVRAGPNGSVVEIRK
jgi:exonuclease SbcC